MPAFRYDDSGCASAMLCHAACLPLFSKACWCCLREFTLRFEMPFYARCHATDALVAAAIRAALLAAATFRRLLPAYAAAMPYVCCRDARAELLATALYAD